MEQKLSIEAIPNVPQIKPGDGIAAAIIAAIEQNKQQLSSGDIICIASKVLSVSENRFIDLRKMQPSAQAHALHQKIPQKDPRTIQLILDQAVNSKRDIRQVGNWIGVKGHIGRMLTSAGIDRVDNDTVLLLPEDPDQSARTISAAIMARFNVRVAVLITDSDGREGIAGATQVCIGLYGITPVREQNRTQETICDMLAAAAGLLMGQRGNNIPAVIIKKFPYTFDANAQLKDAY